MSNYRHGLTRTRTWNIWRAMLNRMRGTKLERYSHVSMCERWNTFENFVEDVGICPSDEHTLDRVDSKGNYEPGNVRWATYTEQQRNTKKNINFTINGTTRCLSEWCEVYGVPYVRTYKRLQRGWSIERALNQSGRVRM